MKLHPVFYRGLKSLTAAALLAALVCGCARDEASAPTDPSSAASHQNPMATSADAAMDDGVLRILYNGNGASIVFHGATPVYATPAHGSAWLVTDLAAEDDRLSAGQARYFVGQVPEGSDSLHRTLYDADGTAVYDLGTQNLAGLYGDWILVGEEGCCYFYSENGGYANCRFIDLRTGEERPGPEQLAYLGRAGDGLFLICCGGTDENPTFTTLLLDSRLQETTRLENTSAYGLYWNGTLPNYLNLETSLSAKDGGSWYESTERSLYNVRTGEAWPNFEQQCGPDALCFKTDDGRYTVCRLHDGKTLAVYDEPCSVYLDAAAPLVLFWQGNAEYLQIGDAAPLPLKGYSFNESSTDSLAVLTEEETPRLLAYDADGSLRFEITPALHTAEYNNCYTSLSQPADGMVLLYESYYPDNGEISHAKTWMTLYDAGGSVLLQTDGTTYQNIYGLDDTGLLCGYRNSAGGSSVYDLLDLQGNVVVSGLGVVSSYGNGILSARKGFECGWMDTAGNWLWHTSIFSQVSDESSMYLYR